MHGWFRREARFYMTKLAMENIISIKESTKFEVINVETMDPNKFQSISLAIPMQQWILNSDEDYGLSLDFSQLNLRNTFLNVNRLCIVNLK